MTSRYWDGRTRQVVEIVRRVAQREGRIEAVIERLECGHLFARTGHVSNNPIQWRVCAECEAAQ